MSYALKSPLRDTVRLDGGVCISAEDPDLWYSMDSGDIVEARRICRTQCPVAEQCLIEALRVEGNATRGNRYGVRGGCTPGERRALFERHIAPRLPEDQRNPKKRGPGRSLAPCGTEAAKARHRRNGETCTVCRVGLKGAA